PAPLRRQQGPRRLGRAPRRGPGTPAPARRPPPGPRLAAPPRPAPRRRPHRPPPRPPLPRPDPERGAEGVVDEGEVSGRRPPVVLRQGLNPLATFARPPGGRSTRGRPLRPEGARP